jgi:hypothetical protein
MGLLVATEGGSERGFEGIGDDLRVRLGTPAESCGTVSTSEQSVSSPSSAYRLVAVDGRRSAGRILDSVSSLPVPGKRRYAFGGMGIEWCHPRVDGWRVGMPWKAGRLRWYAVIDVSTSRCQNRKGDVRTSRSTSLLFTLLSRHSSSALPFPSSLSDRNHRFPCCTTAEWLPSCCVSSLGPNDGPWTAAYASCWDACKAARRCGRLVMGMLSSRAGDRRREMLFKMSSRAIARFVMTCVLCPPDFSRRKTPTLA